ncbi:ATP-binding protein [Pseudoalteromonas sp. ACER1]|uniref:histidine kinase n=1 Tax=Pseudoalteromonas lipolytica TaxID=570156 RepID=A0A0N8HKS8_9GAMM|nr:MULTISPECIES: ATP-binding protein [Pseudoalteromonas]MED5513469.1 ATP-binding protein [Pseudomonadota bacterium]KPM84720.1 histidine kinase [Pseudoalteromonas lipolytica]MBC7006967.1 response regulator [Pseudoalteromonas sp. BZK2]MCF2847235.1 ATP-binding protein [Pseudoalteromonas sp. PAST1]MCO7209556.1 ATP-binding protein [Pseudoalteromonas sp. ACER1]
MNFLRQFHNIVSDQNTDFSEKITELLKFGLDVFNLDFAIISRVENNVYTVIHVIAPDDAIAVGTQFELSGTYCTHTLTANKAISFHQASKSTIAEHPCYLNFKLESYIGAPIFVGNKVFGTLNFSAPQASPPFNDDAHDYVELFAQWLGNEFARNSASKKLIKKNSMLAQVEKVAKIGSWELDLASNRLYWSKQTKAIHEVPEDFTPLLDNAIEYYKKGPSRDAIELAVKEAIEDGKQWNIEIELITAKGKPIWVSTFGEPEFKNGKCVRLIGTFQDITKSVLLREELKKQKADAERTLEDRSILLAKISHELRTPLNGITGMLTTLLYEKSEQKREEKLKVALRSADILLNIINEVLDFSKINHGELKLEPCHFLLKTIFVDLASLYLPLYQEKNLNFEVDIDISDKCWTYCDNTRITQIVSNLLSNALKFTEQGDIKLRAVAQQQGDDVLLNLRVSDSGVGMSESFMKSLFSPFTQEVNKERKKGGTGLGLAIVKELIDYMGGSIKVTSEYGKGSCFDIQLTLKRGVAQTSDLITAANIDFSTLPLSILVVDDNQINRFVLKAHLEKLGLTADYACDGIDAINKCKQNNYNLIFMDCVMPEMDGIEATSILREELICPVHKTYIVALTANTSADDKAACKRAGMDLFVSKPVKNTAIEQAIISAKEHLFM